MSDWDDWALFFLGTAVVVPLVLLLAADIIFRLRNRK